MRLIDRLRPTNGEARHSLSNLTFDQWMNFQGQQYWLGGNLAGSKPDQADGSYVELINKVHGQSGPVSSAVFCRQLVIGDLQFQWKRALGTANAGELWGNQDLAVLERPGSATRSTFLRKLELDASYAGNAYVVRPKRDRLYRLDPSRVSFAFGSDSDPGWADNGDIVLPYDAEVVGIIYDRRVHHTGPAGPNDLQVFRPGDYAHWMPEPHGVHWWKGSSWVASLVREIAVDGQVIDHQSKYFENAATGRMVFMMDKSLAKEDVEAYGKVANRLHAGTGNAFKNTYIGGGVDKVEVVGNSLKDVGGELLSASMETRVSQRSRVHGSVLSIAISYQGSTLNTGNYAAARRQWSDIWFSPTSTNLCESLESIVPPPPDNRLAYDPAQIMFLQEDEKDAADIMARQIQAYRQGVDAGAEPDTVRDAIKTNDIGKIEHTGLTSVQLLPPGENGADDDRALLPAVFDEFRGHVLTDVGELVSRALSTVDRGSPVTIQNTIPDVRVEFDHVNVHQPDVVVNVPEQARQEPPVVNVPAPIVNVEAPQVTVDAPVTVEVPAWPAPDVHVTVEQPATRHRVKRDKDGRITEVVEEGK